MIICQKCTEYRVNNHDDCGAYMCPQHWDNIEQMIGGIPVELFPKMPDDGDPHHISN